MGNVIKIDDGSEVFDIVNTRGELLGQFTFIPSDFDLMKRYDYTVKVFENIQHELIERSEAEKQEGMEEEANSGAMEYLKSLDKRMGEAIDYLFNAPVSEKFFSITSPFTMLNSGQFYVENVINAIRAVIEQKRNVKLQAVQSQVEKYTQRYKVGPGGYIAPVK